VLFLPVVDRTGLDGYYDFTLEWTPRFEPAVPRTDGPIPKSTHAEANRAAVIPGVREQLGLRLEPRKAPVEFIVIDHAERPSENWRFGFGGAAPWAAAASQAACLLWKKLNKRG
jgi:uncharacterized protein (TIGR03435 family)